MSGDHAPTSTVTTATPTRAQATPAEPAIAVAAATTADDRAACRLIRDAVFGEEMRLARDGGAGAGVATTGVELLARVDGAPAAVTRVVFRTPGDPRSVLPMEAVFDLDELAGLAIAEIPGTAILPPYRHTSGLVRMLWTIAAGVMLAGRVTHAVARVNVDTDDMAEAALVHDAVVRAGSVFRGGRAHPRDGGGPPHTVARRLSPQVAAALPEVLPPTVGLFCSIGGRAIGPPVYDHEIAAVSLPMIWDVAATARRLAGRDRVRR